jgi:hypothetical protein
MTNAVNGSFAPAEALQRMIAGTPLTFVMSNERTITVWSCKEFACQPRVSSDSQPQPRTNITSAANAATRPIVEQVDVNGNRVKRDRFTPQPSLEKISVGKQQIEQSGAVTLADALRSLTQILSGGALPTRRVSRTSWPTALRCLQWRLQRIAALLAVNYCNHYRDTLSIPNRNISSWTTLDTQASYEVDGFDRSPLAGTEILLTASNLLGRASPFVNQPARSRL